MFQVVQQVVAASWALDVINNQSLPIDLKIGEKSFSTNFIFEEKTVSLFFWNFIYTYTYRSIVLFSECFPREVSKHLLPKTIMIVEFEKKKSIEIFQNL